MNGRKPPLMTEVGAYRSNFGKPDGQIERVGNRAPPAAEFDNRVADCTSINASNKPVGMHLTDDRRSNEIIVMFFDEISRPAQCVRHFAEYFCGPAAADSVLAALARNVAVVRQSAQQDHFRT